MTNIQRARKIHTELIQQWPTCDELYRVARYDAHIDGMALEQYEDAMGMTALLTAGEDCWGRQKKVTRKDITKWCEWAEEEVQNAIERSGEAERRLVEHKEALNV